MLEKLVVLSTSVSLVGLLDSDILALMSWLHEWHDVIVEIDHVP